jgi:putative sterol carrier protein
MATEGEVKMAIDALVDRMEELDVEKLKQLPDRRLALYLLDLDVSFAGEMAGGRIVNIRTEEGDYQAQLRLICTSDDFVALEKGDLHFAQGWATGRFRLDASFRDLLKLRALA